MFDTPVVSVHIPLVLRPYAGGHEEITASGDSVHQVLDALIHEHPAIRDCLVAPDGALLPGIAIFLGPRSIREMQGLSTPIGLEEVMSIVSVSNP